MHSFTPIGSKQSKDYKIKESLDKIEELIIFDEDFNKANDLLEAIDVDSLNKTNKKMYTFLKAFYLDKKAKPIETIELIEPLYNSSKEVNDFYSLLNSAIPLTSSLYKVGKADYAFTIIEHVEMTKETNNLSFRDSITNKKFASLKNIKGIVYFIKGDIVKASRSFEESLKIYTDLNDQKNMAMLYNNIGNIYIFLGNIVTAIDYLSKSLEIRKGLNNKLEIASTLGNIAESLVIQNKLQEALKYFLESLDLFLELDEAFFLSQLYYHLVYTYVKLKTLEKASFYYKNLIQLFNKEKEKVKTNVDKLRILETVSPLKLYVDLSHAKLLKQTPRIFDQFEAGVIFRDISLRNDIELDIRFKASLEYIEILFIELKISNDEQLIEEMKSFITDLISFAKEVKTVYIELQLSLLLANIYLLNFQMSKCNLLLKETIAIAEENELFNYAVSTTLASDRIINQYSQWLELQKTNASIQQRLDLLNIESIISVLKENKSAVVEDIESETPQMISIFTEDGLSLYSHSFKNENITDDQIIAGFLTAINEFGKQMFTGESSDTNIEQLKFKNSMILLKKESKITVSYLFNGPSYYALKKLNDLVNKIKSASEIWFYLTANTIPEINDMISGKITGFINEIFD
jgi:tetratricopeptide (TPR) repeat protein